MAAEKATDRKVRGVCRACGKGVHLWETVADGVVQSSGWEHDKAEHETHRAVPR